MSFNKPKEYTETELIKKGWLKSEKTKKTKIGPNELFKNISNISGNISNLSKKIETIREKKSTKKTIGELKKEINSKKIQGDLLGVIDGDKTMYGIITRDNNMKYNEKYIFYIDNNGVKKKYQEGGIISKGSEVRKMEEGGKQIVLIYTPGKESQKLSSKTKKITNTTESNQEKNKKYIKYNEKLNEKGLSKETEQIIIEGINKYLINRTLNIGGEKIKFTEEYINDNKYKFTQNIKFFLITLMNIESYGGKDIENKESSAKGPLQWIDGWKNEKKHKKYNRGKGRTSPFETALKRVSKYYTGHKYPKFESEKIPDYIKKAWNDGGKLKSNNFDIEKQIQLWYIDILMRKGKAKDYLMGTMNGDKWSAKQLYEKIHHTESIKGSKTKDVVNKHFKYLSLL